MSKSTIQVLLLPGEIGWEIWTGQADTGFTLQAATELSHVSELPDLPGGDITLFFPVKSITSIPMKVASEDDALFPDLAALHAERLGLRPDPMAGQLTDLFVIAREKETTALVSVLLRPPVDADLPKRGPKEFDLSCRAYPISGDALAVWKELGRWVFSLYHQGTLVYCQATAVSSAEPDESLVREIRLSLIQLSLQGIDIEPAKIHLWTTGSSPAALQGAFHAPVEISPRPSPVPPKPGSKLLPADIRAARREAQRRQKIQLAVAAVALLYLGLLGWFAFGLWQDVSQTKKLRQAAAAAAPEGEAYAAYIAQWDELAQAIDLNYSPVDILSRVARCIPPNSGLRLKTAEVTANEIKLIGEASSLENVSKFNLALNRSNELARFTWSTPEPNQTNRGWEFVYTASTSQP